MIGNKCETEMFGKACYNIVFLDQGSEDVHAGQNGLTIFISCDNGAIVVWIEFVSFFVRNVCQVVSQLFARYFNIIIIE